MGTKKLPLNVEWTNGVVSNEIQDGVKPQYIILKGGEKMLLEALNIDLPAEGNTTRKGIAFLYLKNGEPTPFNRKMLHENLDLINSTLLGLGRFEKSPAWNESNHWMSDTKIPDRLKLVL